MHPHLEEELAFANAVADRFDGFDRGDRDCAEDREEEADEAQVVGRMRNWLGAKVEIVKLTSDGTFVVGVDGTFGAEVFASVQEAAAFAKKTHFVCWKCKGDGKFYGRGEVQNGVFRGFVGECYQCNGTGISLPKDEKRTAAYWKYYGKGV